MRFIAAAGLVFLCVFHAAAAADDAGQAAAPEGQAETGGQTETGGQAETGDQVNAAKAELEKHAAPKATGNFDLGFGLGWQDSPGATPMGWDVMAGYQWMESEGWRAGVQLHWMDGTLFSESSFQSAGLWLTANPRGDFVRHFQFKAGIVHDSYSSASTQYIPIPTYPYSTTQTLTTAWGGNGMGAGIALIIPFEHWQLHLLDVEHHVVAGHEYNVYTISIVVLAELLR